MNFKKGLFLIIGFLCFLQTGCHYAAEGQKGLAVKVMTFNIRTCHAKDGPNGWEYRRAMVVDVIKKARVDAVGLQEADQPQAEQLREDLDDYEILATYRDGKSHGHSNALLYRKSRFTADSWGTFWLSDTPDVPNSIGWGNQYSRFCTWARLIEKQSGRAFYFFNAHLDHISQESRERSAVLIMQKINQRKTNDPVVLTGDMNIEEDNPAIHYFKGTGDLVIDGQSYSNTCPLVDTFRVRHGLAVLAGTFNDFGKHEVFPKIDYVLTQQSVEVLDAEVIKYNDNGRYPSDHCPVTAIIRFPDLMTEDKR